MIRVTVWNEYRHERTEEAVRRIYPEGIHAAIAAFLGRNGDMTVRTATLDEPEHGLSESVLNDTDVLLWWGHMAHREVRDEVVRRVCGRVLDGMGLIVLHSGHDSKVFQALMGTRTGKLRWHEDADPVRVWKIDYTHPITKGIGDYFELPQEETYGEHFDIPEPDELLFVNWYPSGEVFRSGITYRRGMGRIFYFQPGHETYPSYYDANVQRVITNAVRWAARDEDKSYVTGHTAALPDMK